MKSPSPDETATWLGALRSWERPAPANYDWPAHVRRVAASYEAERDRARSWNFYLAAACVGLFIALLYVASHPTRLTKTAPVCPQSGVMQLDPTAILARKSQSVEI